MAFKVGTRVVMKACPDSRREQWWAHAARSYSSSGAI